VQPLEDMLKFIYTGSITPYNLEASGEHLLRLIETGDKYQCDSLICAALEMLRARHHPQLHTQLLKLPENIRQGPRVKSLLERAKIGLVDAFKNVEKRWDGPSFLGLSMQSLIILLQSEDLEANTEENVFKYCLQWVQNAHVSPEERKEAMEEVSRFIRFLMMRGEYLMSLMDLPELEGIHAKIMSAAWFQSFSAEKKIVLSNENGLQYQQRNGIFSRTDKHIYFRFNRENLERLRKGNECDSDQAALLGGVEWHISLGLCSTDEDVHLHISLKAPGDELDSFRVLEPTRVNFSLAVTRWPEGVEEDLLPPSCELSFDMKGNVEGCQGRCFTEYSFEQLLLSSECFDEDGCMEIVARLRLVDGDSLADVPPEDVEDGEDD
jgi:hypothetical protein